MTEDFDSFARAFVAVSYALGRRGDDLVAPLTEPGPTCQKLVTALAHPERNARAIVLAREIARIAQALEARRLT